MTELRNELKEIIPTTDISLQKILNNLLDAEKNLELKTHILKPKQLASLFILSDYLNMIKLPKSSLLIQDFINLFLKYMVSFKRLSRTEIIKAISAIREMESLSTKEKLTTNLK